MVTAAEVAAKVYAPAQIFALIDSAIRAEEGRTIDQHRDEIAALWTGFSVPVPRRRDLHRWPAMELAGARAADHLGSPLSALEHIELYRCFPAAVRVQQRALGLLVDGVPTVTGGEPFAGGPWNNFALQSTPSAHRRHAVARAVRRAA